MIRLLVLILLASSLLACLRTNESSTTASAPPTRTLAQTNTATATESPGRLTGLDGTEWIVTMIGNEPAAPDLVARFRFVNGNAMSASIACDGAGAEYRITGSVFALTERLQRTYFICEPGEDPREQSDDVFSAIDDLHSFSAIEVQLEFFASGGRLLLTLDQLLPPPIDPLLEGD